MSASLPRTHGKPFAKHAVARRAGVGNTKLGYLFCDGCGASTVTRAELAEAAGVTPYMLSKWLNRMPVPQRVADAIRAQLLRVEE